MFDHGGFGALVKEHRGLKGWTQAELAGQVWGDIGRKGDVSRIENGRIENLREDTVRQLIDKLGIPEAEADALRRPPARNELGVHAKLDEILARLGGGAAALAQAEHLSLEELQALAAGFGETGLTGKAALVAFLTKKAEDFRRLEGEIAALRGVSARTDNVCAAAEQAISDMRLDEASRLLEDARETIRDQLRAPLEANARLMEAQTDIALIRGRVEEAYRILSSAADSFASIDLRESARRRLRYANRLYQHGRRYGGRGLALSAEMNRATLGILTEADHGVDWAGTQTNLANALQTQGRQTGGAAGAALLAEAVAAYRAALLVWTEANHPVDWAMTQNNLAVAHEAQGTRTGGAAGAALLAEAVAACRASLRVRTEAVHPVEWAGTQNNLANALQAQGTQAGGAAGAALLAEAVAAYRAALRVRTEADHPVDWAMTQNNLAGALQTQGARTGGAEGAALLAEAVAACRAALRVRTEADHPVDWAATQTNLANALQTQGRQTGGAAGAALLAEAVAAYRAVLRVRTEADHPVHWAETQTSLASALEAQGRWTAGAEGAALLAEAVTACRAALRVGTEADHPVLWAITMENLALAEDARADHATCADPRPHLEAALDHVAAALRVYDPEHMTYHHGTATTLRDSLAKRLAALR